MNYSVIKTKNVIGKFKKETPKDIWIGKFFCLRSKMYAFNCGDDSKNKLKVFLKVNREVLNLRNITFVYLEENINKNVKNILFVHLTMKRIFKE